MNKEFEKLEDEKKIIIYTVVAPKIKKKWGIKNAFSFYLPSLELTSGNNNGTNVFLVISPYA